MTYIYFKKQITNDYTLSAVMGQSSPLRAITLASINNISPELAEACEDYIIDILGCPKCVRYGDFINALELAARRDSRFLELSFEMNRYTLEQMYSETLNKVDAEVVFEDEAVFEAGYEDYKPVRNYTLNKINELRETLRWDKITSKNHSAIGQKVTDRINKVIDSRPTSQTKALINESANYATTRTTSSSRNLLIKKAWEALANLIDEHQPQTPDEVYELATNAATKVYTHQKLQIRVNQSV